MTRKEKLENQKRVQRELDYMNSVVEFETWKENLEKTLYWLVEQFRKTGNQSLAPAIQYVQNCLYSYMHEVKK